MMNRVFAVISPHFEDFGSHDWVSWFTVKLIALLPSLTPEMLQTATSSADCNAYHVMRGAPTCCATLVGALSSVFEQLTSPRQQELTPVLLAYLKQSQASGSTCGSNSGSLSTCLWECFGKFSIYVDYEDPRGLIEGFAAVGALSSVFEQLTSPRQQELTPVLLAYLKQSQASGSTWLQQRQPQHLSLGMLWQILHLRDYEDPRGSSKASQPLTRTPQALDINPVVRDIMMNRVFAVVSPHFEDFGSHDWVSWFTVKLIPLLPSLTPEMLQTATSSADCNAYHVIVGALSSVFEQLTSPRQRELTPVLLAYLKQSQASGRSSGGGAWLNLWLQQQQPQHLSLGMRKFSIYVDYEDLRGLFEDFGSFEALDLLSASRCPADTKLRALNNANLIVLVFDRLTATMLSRMSTSS
ncbi:hypothetical protein G5714_024627 [Onychostoma macrolepis]|uniref:Uncharacterized protein n=1 Tax=Onychostoma macrolepis TaxID=369639 RepID=A0A7J6BI14_9TELE|nr:hypothetical protein G5714_024627 [Onychostoma macrolepis]